MLSLKKEQKEIIKKAIWYLAKPSPITSIISISFNLLTIATGIVVTIMLCKLVNNQSVANKNLKLIIWLVLFIGLIMLWRTLIRVLCQNLHYTIWPEKRIVAGVKVVGTEYDILHFLDSQTKEIIIVGQNLYSCFENTSLVDRIVYSIKTSKTKIVCILTTREAMASIDTSGKGTAVRHYDSTINTLKDIYWNKLSTSDERKRLSVYLHLGSATLSATIRDPEDIIRARLVFMPKWAIDVNPAKRLYCVIDKWEYPTLFETIYSDINHMMLIDEKRMDWGEPPKEMNNGNIKMQPVKDEHRPANGGGKDRV